MAVMRQVRWARRIIFEPFHSWVLTQAEVREIEPMSFEGPEYRS
jgi:hypothetical protein